jgi:hypothetical protein
MQSQPEVASTRPDPRVGALPLRALILVALLGVGLAFFSLATPAEPARPFDARCEPWDDAASVAIARLVATRDETAEAFLGDAVFRLRRARRNCRSGWIGLARLDYDALSAAGMADRYRLKRGGEADNGNRTMVERPR